MRRSALVVLGLLRALTASAAPDDPIAKDTFAVAPGPSGSIWTLTVAGHVERFDEAGKRVEDLKMVSPWADRLWDGLRRIEPVPGGVLVLSMEGLVKVTAAGSKVLADGRLVRGAIDFAASADGKVVVIVANDADNDVRSNVSALEAGKLRRIGTIDGYGVARVAVDPAGTWVAVQRRTTVYSDAPGTLAVFAIADGKQMFAQKLCSGGIVRALDSTALAACFPNDKTTDSRFGVAVYAVPSGKVARSWTGIDDAIAVSRDRRVILVNGLQRDGSMLSVLDLATGKRTDLPTAWISFEEANVGSGVWLGRNRVAMPGARVEPRPSLIYDVAASPWARRAK